MKILGIESTCDETGVAVVEDGFNVLSNVVSSSLEIQKEYGGIVPEVAARAQVKVIIPLLRSMLSNISVRDIDAIAVAIGPGLIGSLLIGVETAKCLAFSFKKPLIPVNHLIGHLYANWLSGTDQFPVLPSVGLVVSGGHTDIVFLQDHGKFKLIGSTLDDAAGEAFDKVARLLGLGYPGGPMIETLVSKTGFQKFSLQFHLPRPMIKSQDFNFSFSGLKTAVVNLLKEKKVNLSSIESKNKNRDLVAYIAYEFQEAIVDVLTEKIIKAANYYRTRSIIIGGGVSANKRLREKIKFEANKRNFSTYLPKKNFSVDNGAMIGAAAHFNPTICDPISVEANPNLHF